MEAFFNSFLVVAIAEIGDKTQLLSLLLVNKFKRPWPILWGILIATILNHWFATYAGGMVINFVSEDLRKWFLAALFAFFGFWALIPDRADELKTKHSYGAFVTSLICFFVAEMGDKTQLATMAMGARYQSHLMVTLGTTLGMMAANVPVVLLGEKVLKILPLAKIRLLAALTFFAFAIYIALT